MKTLTITLLIATTLVFNLNAANPTASRPQAVAGAIASSLKKKTITAQPSTDMIVMTEANYSTAITYTYTITITPGGIEFEVTNTTGTSTARDSYNFAKGTSFKGLLKTINDANIKNEPDPDAMMLCGAPSIDLSLYKGYNKYATIDSQMTGSVYSVINYICRMIPDYSTERTRLENESENPCLDPLDPGYDPLLDL